MWTPFIAKQRKSRQRKSSPRQASRRSMVPRLEQLEDRFALATFTVTSTADDGSYVNPLLGTLRAAIFQANLNPDHDTINFSVSGTIAPLNALPAIINPVTIDGVGRSITIDGSSTLGAANGLQIHANGCAVRNLTVTRFSDHGIILINSSHSTIEGNQITLNGGIRTRSDQGVAGIGVLELPGGAADFNTVRDNNIIGNLFGLGIGGGASNNLVSGNTISNSIWDGVFMFSDADVPQATVTSGNDVVDNTITGNAIGIVVHGGTDRAINLGVMFNTIANNTITNNQTGVVIDGFLADNNSLFGNTIRNNSGPGVRLSGGADLNTIGGSGTAMNFIDLNSGPGIIMQSEGFDFFPGFPGYQAHGDPTGNNILGNSIHNNGGQAQIDLNNDGITFNDVNDSDSGPNNLQNFPVLSEAVTTGGLTAISGILDTTPSGGVYRIDFYAAPANADQTYLGPTFVTADTGGQARYTVTFPAVPVGHIVVATATDSAGNTSEFSPAVVTTSFTPTSASPANGAIGSIAVAPPSSGTLVGLDAVTSPAPPSNPPPAGVNFPVGFVEFAVIGLSPGAASTVTLTLDVPPGQTVSEYWKYGPELGDLSPHWYRFMFNGTTGAVITQISATQFVVTLSLVDGERGDYDLTANGIIVDPGAPAVSTNTVTTVTSEVSSAVYGQQVTFAAMVSALDPAAGTPTGTVQFYAEGSALGAAVALTNGTASISAAALSSGLHNVTAVYVSDQPAFVGSVPLSPFVETITPAPLTVMANDSTRAAGAANPAFTASYAGFVLGEGDSVLLGELVYSTPADASSAPGDYPITVGGQSAANYSITFVEGTLTVAPVQAVEIEILRNDVNLASNGVIAVAVFTTASFDAALVDAGSVVFAGAHAVHSALADVDGDGDLDMVLHFRTQDTNLRALYEQLLADDLNGDGVLDSTHQQLEVSLTGQTVDDVFFEGLDELDLFLSGKSLRELLLDLAAAGRV